MQVCGFSDVGEGNKFELRHFCSFFFLACSTLKRNEWATKVF